MGAHERILIQMSFKEVGAEAVEQDQHDMVVFSFKRFIKDAQCRMIWLDTVVVHDRSGQVHN